ncbi:MAG TPA: hypothetical protein PL033_02995 [Candidatus Brocadiia bacterium]|nr:hypothetical protein [Candidatus Brocadiia bacterium]
MLSGIDAGDRLPAESEDRCDVLAPLMLVWENHSNPDRLSEIFGSVNLDDPLVAEALVRDMNMGRMITASFILWGYRAKGMSLVVGVLHRIDGIALDELGGIGRVGAIECFPKCYELGYFPYAFLNDKSIVPYSPPNMEAPIQIYDQRFGDRASYDYVHWLREAGMAPEYIRSPGNPHEYSVPDKDEEHYAKQKELHAAWDKYIQSLKDWGHEKRFDLLHKQRSFIVELIETDWPAKPDAAGPADGDIVKVFASCADGTLKGDALKRAWNLDDPAVASFTRRQMNEPGDAGHDQVLSNIFTANGPRGMSFIIANYHRMDADGRACVIRMMRGFDYFESWRVLAAFLGKAGPAEQIQGGMRVCDIAFNVLLEKLRADKRALESLKSAQPITPETAMADRDALVAAAKAWWETGQDALLDAKPSFILELVKVVAERTRRTNEARDAYRSAYGLDTIRSVSRTRKIEAWTRYLQEFGDRGYKVEVARARLTILRGAAGGEVGSGARNPSKLTLQLGKGVGMDLVLIQPGEFMMGEQSGQGNALHKVRLTKGFYMGIRGQRPYILLDIHPSAPLA